METMAFLGPQGTHSEAAAIYMQDALQMDCQLRSYPNIYSAIQAVEEGEVDSCLVPVENSIEGTINITLDALAHSDTLQVARELIWGVHNQLAAKCADANVKCILSHSQPLAQCRKYIMAHYPKARLEAVVSTSAAAAMVAKSAPEEGLAAICTQRAAQLNGLVTLATEIQDRRNNCTRFYQLKRKGAAEEPNPTKTLVICQIDGKEAGCLCKVLQEFAYRSVNMTRIESRPTSEGLGEYIFFFDLEIPEARYRLFDAIQAVKERSIWLKTAGLYPVLVADRVLMVGINYDKASKNHECVIEKYNGEI